MVWPLIIGAVASYLTAKAVAKENRKTALEVAERQGGGGGGGPNLRSTTGGAFDSSNWNVVTGSGNKQSATSTSASGPPVQTDWKLPAMIGLGALLAWKATQEN